jgi:hypothetical protein
MIEKCKWHEGEEPITDEWAACPQCSTQLADRTCIGCGERFLDWKHENGDDIIATPRVSSSGDLCCSECWKDMEPDNFPFHDDGYYY